MQDTGGRHQSRLLAKRDDKAALRKSALAYRRKLRPEDLRASALGLRDVLLTVPEVGRAAVVALYVGVGTEPGTGPLLDELVARGVRILLPVVTTDLDLDWAAYSGPDALHSARMGLLEPTEPTLGIDAIGTADAVLVPGLIVDHRGMRLGRGAGCYDKTLTRVAPDAFTCALLHDGEAVDHELPTEPHDQPVRALATPSGLRRFG